MKNKSIVLFLLAIFVIFSTIFVIFKLDQAKTVKQQDLISNWELADSAIVHPDDYVNQYTLERLIRGRILEYNQKDKTLKIKYSISTATADKYIDFPISLDQVVFCWPQYSNGIDISEAFMPLDPKKIIYIKNEKAALLGDIIDNVISKYVFLQTDENQQLLKLAIIACYD